MEASCWGIPTICSPNADNERFVNAGALIADTPEAVADSSRGLCSMKVDISWYATRPSIRAWLLSSVDDQAKLLLEFAAAQKSREV